jgi:hypothetical protein
VTAADICAPQRPWTTSMTTTTTTTITAQQFRRLQSRHPAGKAMLAACRSCYPLPAQSAQPPEPGLSRICLTRSSDAPLQAAAAAEAPRRACASDAASEASTSTAAAAAPSRPTPKGLGGGFDPLKKKAPKQPPRLTPEVDDLQQELLSLLDDLDFGGGAGG